MRWRGQSRIRDDRKPSTAPEARFAYANGRIKAEAAAAARAVTRTSGRARRIQRPHNKLAKRRATAQAVIAGGWMTVIGAGLLAIKASRYRRQPAGAMDSVELPEANVFPSVLSFFCW